MYISTFNPSQAIALSQGYQSGATALPVNIRPGIAGHTITYSFNPALASAPATGMAVNPVWSQSMALNPANLQSIYGLNPFLNPAGMAYNPAMLSGAAAPFAAQLPFHTIQSSTGMAQMRVDLSETNSDVVIACELPNVSLNDLNLTVTDDSMTISAIAWAGNRPTSLFRNIALPTSIRSEQVEATYSNGILEIRAPKSDIATRRRVKINVAQ